MSLLCTQTYMVFYGKALHTIEHQLQMKWTKESLFSSYHSSVDDV